MVSIFYSLKLIFVLLFCGGLLLFVMREGRPLSIWKPVAAVSIFLVGCILVPGDFDRAYVNPELPPAKYPVTAMKSNGAVTTFVVTRRNDKRLYFGNLSMSSSNALSQTYMRVMAHFPLLAQRNPEKVLLIAFGVGNTASAIAAHNTVSQIDIVDLNSKVFETAPEFSDSNGNVHLDPRVRLIHDDGRSFLSIVDERYDLITSEPPPPMAAGVYRLYSREYYEDVLAHLTPTGMMSQWLPYYQMPPEAVVRAIGTFITVFPHALLISGMSEELILIGASAPFELERIHERFSQSSAVSQDLEQHIISEPVDLYARIMQTSKELQENYAGVGLISDQNNHLDHSFPGWNRIAKISYDPVRVLEELRQQSPSVADELEPIVTHLGRLNFRIPAFPLYDVRPDPSIKYSAVDWTAVTRRYRSAIALAAQGKGPESAAAFLAALQLAPENPHILSYLAQLYLEYDRPAEAEKAFRRVVAVEPERTDIYLLLATAVVAQGRGEDAIPAYRKALSFDPDNADALQQLAWILATHPEAEVRREREAVLLAEQANLQSNGEDAEILNTLAATYAANGRFDKAIQNAEAAIQVAKISEDKVVAEKSRDQLVLYRQHRPVTDHSLQP
jgi:tetratricopeptide (TPR) repeat protein